MAYTARQLITRSWYLSGIVSRSFQTVEGTQLDDGLFLLNSLLAIKSVNTDLVPYYKIHDFVLAYDTEEYTIPNCLMVEDFTFFINDVRYPTNRAGRKQFFGSGRANNIQSLPFQWRFDRELGGGKLRLYFKPAAAYPAQIVGKFGFDSVNVNTDMSTVYDPFYIEFLRYSLAEYMCQDSGYDFPYAQKLQEITDALSDLSPPDMSSRKVQMINSPVSVNYAQINLGQGFTPP